MLELLCEQASFGGRVAQPLGDVLTVGVGCSEPGSPGHAGIEASVPRVGGQEIRTRR
jgi:hypothetical protein